MKKENIVIPSNDSINKLTLMLEKVFDKLNDNTILCHYTDVNGLYGIIKSDSFWLTQREFMNDIAEPYYSQKLIENVLADKKSSFNFEEIKSRFHFWKNDFILSFSTEIDSIHQWNYYSGGYGYCITFKKESIMKCLREKITENTLGPVIYDEDIQKKSIELLISSIEGLEENSNGYENYYYSIEKWLMSFYSLFKQKNHNCEKEVRFIVNNTTLPVKYRIRNNIIVPYISLENLKLPIHEIWIGPKINKKLAKPGLEKFLQSQNKCAIIRNSDIYIQ